MAAVSASKPVGASRGAHFTTIVRDSLAGKGSGAALHADSLKAWDEQWPKVPDVAHTSKEFDVNLVYGELKNIQSCISVARDAASMLQRKDCDAPLVFVDLGAGLGKPVVGAALSGAFSRSIGIEIRPDLVELAQTLWSKLDSSEAVAISDEKTDTTYQQASARAFLVQGSILDKTVALNHSECETTSAKVASGTPDIDGSTGSSYGSLRATGGASTSSTHAATAATYEDRPGTEGSCLFDWTKEADVAFCHSTAFDLALMRKLERRAEDLRFGRVLVTVTHKLSSPLLEHVCSRKIDMTHGEGTLHFYRRRRMGKWVAGVLGRPR